MSPSSLGIRVSKQYASKVIELVKKQNAIDTKFKIQQTGDFVEIPLLEKLDLHIPHEFKEINFKVKNKRPASIKEAIMKINNGIPEEIMPSSFDHIGDIAVIDLKEELLPYKTDIGKAILSFQPSIVSVYRKSGKVSGEHRTWDLELIAGIDKTKTIHKEYGLKIHVDVKRAYFSPRLGTEHNRIAEMVEDNELVLDMFGGVAPYALHIAKDLDVLVITIDINPLATELIDHSIADNSLRGEIIVLEGDTRVIGEDLISNSYKFDKIIMNHPSRAIEYLDLAQQLIKSDGKIFLYTFAPMENQTKYCKDLLNNYNLKIDEIHSVRQSSPSEEHICITLSE